ncbi:MAG: protein kinase [Chromatiales bacterium]|nr:protein kinase [Chromatiales bacterium]
MNLDERDIVGRYHVLEPIGHGTMGTVYLGHDPFHDRPVALKIAHQPPYRNRATTDLYKTLFINEMRAAGMLPPPNIIEVLDAGTDGDRYYIAMEYIDGGRTLDHWCAGGRLLPLERVAEVVLKCAQALDYAHRKGVIHRDVKPSNVLVSRSGEIKLADFSVALLTDSKIDETQLLDLVGSPAYMSPEQLCDESITHQSDLFSLGNMLYELLTGRLPFAAETVAGVTHKVLNLEPPPVSRWRDDVPESLERIVRRALARNLVDRYANALEMAAELSMAFSGLHDPLATRAVEGRVDALKRLNFFAEFRDAEIWELLRWAQWREFAAGETLVTEGTDDDTVYVLVDGTVDVSKGGKAVRNLPPGECFGEMTYLSSLKRSATVTACTPVSVLLLNADTIAKASMRCQVHFQRVFIRTLVERLVHTTEDLVRHD